MFTTRPELTGSFGMVSSTHWLASQCGMSALERGGNAFDAAVAAGFVLQVVEPHLNGPGGDVPIMIWESSTERARVICGQGPAPAAATIGAFRGMGLDFIPGTGPLAACVPGQFGAWLTLLRDHGTMSLRHVLGYAIDYALGGFPVLPRVESTVRQTADHFRQYWPTSADLWLAHGRPPRAGSSFRNTDLGQTYATLLADAERHSTDRIEQIEAALRSFYRGRVAETVADFVAGHAVMDDSGSRHVGLLAYDDLASWSAGVEEPLSYTYRGVEVLKPPTWSQGLVFLQQLALADQLELGSRSPDDPETIHLLIECAKLAFADREAFYGDPAFVDVPVEELLSHSYNRDRVGLIDETAYLGPLRPGRPGGRTGRLPVKVGVSDETDIGESLPIGLGEPTVRSDGRAAGDTCHLDVVDRWGNMVAATPSGGWLQSSPTIPGLGFGLGTRAQMFWLEEGCAGSLAPRKRPRSTLSPTLALRNGRPVMAFGTPGGDQQDQWSLAMFLRVVDWGMNLQEAMDAPMWHTSDIPSSFYPRRRSVGTIHLESRLPAETLVALGDRGHRVAVEGAWSQGRHAAVAAHDGLLRAAANARGQQNYAVGR